MRWFGLLCILAAMALTGCVTAPPTPLPPPGPRINLDLAPILEYDHTPDRLMRRALGPIGELSHTPFDQRLTAVRPIYSEFRDNARGTVARDVLWPLYIYRLTPETEDHLGLGGLIRHRNRRATDYQNWFLPIFFQGKSEDGHNYFAIFPLGGNIRDLLGFDDIWFWLFPLYGYARRDTTVSHNVLWPIYNTTHGERLNKWRVFPLYGEATRQNQWENHFLLWPIFHYGRNLDPNGAGRGFAMLPLYGYIHSENHERDTRLTHHTFLWPFFTWLRTEKGTRIHAPWPFFQYRQDFEEAGEDRLYFWPIWGKDNRHDKREWFVLWPIVRHQEESTKDRGDLERLFVLPVYWQFIHRKPDGETDAYRRVWPLFSTDRQGEDAFRFRCLDLWPVRHHEVIERNFAPFWTLYQYQRRDDRRQHDLLWGFYQYRHAEHLEKLTLFPLFSYRKSPDASTRSLHLLLGLVGREHDREGDHTRLLWFLKF